MNHDQATRRTFLRTSGGALSIGLLPLASGISAATGDQQASQAVSPPVSKMGIASTSFLGAAAAPQPGGKPGSWQRVDTLEFLDRCHGLGSAGIQAQINGDPVKVRARAEQLGMWVEAMLSIRNSTPEQLEKAILDAKAAGCTVARDGMLSGRRYETFRSLDEWKAWVAKTYQVIEAALPVFEKHKFTLALENHKDWTADQFAALFKKYSSEYLGACVDFGNNISLLDEPMALIEAAAPYAKSTHAKDMAVRPYADGFELSEVVLGTGLLPLEKIFTILWKANPQIKMSLEMISRDPLKVPCLTDQYWVTFPDRNGLMLARALRLVETHKSDKLPMFSVLDAAEWRKKEIENIEACMRYKV